MVGGDLEMFLGRDAAGPHSFFFQFGLTFVVSFLSHISQLHCVSGGVQLKVFGLAQPTVVHGCLG